MAPAQGLSPGAVAGHQANRPHPRMAAKDGGAGTVSAVRFVAELLGWFGVLGLAVIAAPHIPAWFVPWGIGIGAALMLIHALVPKPRPADFNAIWLL